MEEKLNKNEISLEISREEFNKRKLLKKYDQLVMLVDIKEEMVVETNDSMLDKSKRDRKRFKSKTDILTDRYFECNRKRDAQTHVCQNLKSSRDKKTYT